MTRARSVMNNINMEKEKGGESHTVIIAWENSNIYCKNISR